MKQIKSKNINFYSRLLQSEDKKKGKKKSLKTIVIIYGISVVSVLGLLFAGSMLLRSKEEANYNAARKKTENTDILQKIEEDNTYENSNKAFKEIINSYDKNNDTVKKADSVLSVLSPDLMNRITSCQTANMAIKSLSINDNILSISCMSDYAESSSEFVSRLENTGLFESVDYGGFIEQGSGYVFTLTAEFLKTKGGTDNG